jgi:hypothetical protein
MVHRTDIAGGSVGRQALFVTACAAVHCKGLSSKAIFQDSSRSGDKKCCRLSTAVPRDNANYLELLTL